MKPRLSHLLALFELSNSISVIHHNLTASNKNYQLCLKLIYIEEGNSHQLTKCDKEKTITFDSFAKKKIHDLYEKKGDIEFQINFKESKITVENDSINFIAENGIRLLTNDGKESISLFDPLKRISTWLKHPIFPNEHSHKTNEGLIYYCDLKY